MRRAFTTLDRFTYLFVFETTQHGLQGRYDATAPVTERALTRLRSFRAAAGCGTPVYRCEGLGGYQSSVTGPPICVA